jgi:hypothetical protein
MLRWEFEHHALNNRQYWEWRALRVDGRVYRHSARPFASFLRAFDDASRHGFDKQRHPWTLATPTYHPYAMGPDPEYRGVTPPGRRKKPQ